MKSDAPSCQSCGSWNRKASDRGECWSGDRLDGDFTQGPAGETAPHQVCEAWWEGEFEPAQLLGPRSIVTADREAAGLVAVRIIHGDCVEQMTLLAEQGLRVDGVVSDPPYHLTSIVSRLGSLDAAPIQTGATGVYARSSTGFMGEQWDGGDVAFRVETWRAAYAVMKPGAHLIAFSATRSYHRMVCAIEDAGFEIRDMVPWLYGTGFPKSHDVATQLEKELCVRIDEGWVYCSDGAEMRTEPPFRSPDATEWYGYGTALKPAIEPVVLARKPIVGSVPDNMRLFGTGALNIDACRIATTDELRAGSGGMPRHSPDQPRGRPGKPYRPEQLGTLGEFSRMPGAVPPNPLGRWPANVCHDGSEEVLEAFATFGERGAAAPVMKRNAPMFGSVYEPYDAPIVNPGATFQGDTGTAARFFYSSKATEGERVFECRTCGAHTLGKPPCGHEDLRSHPTVKPIDLMRWYVRMVCPPGGLILDPFAGTGTTAAAARAEGVKSIMIEQKADHCRDIAVRLGISIEDALAARPQPRPTNFADAGPLFDRPTPTTGQPA